MSVEPTVVERDEQPYVALRSSVTMATLEDVLPPLLPELLRRLGERGLAPVGPPFWKYDVIDMDAQLVVEVGVPVADVTAAGQDARVVAGILPPGRYATVIHSGHPKGLQDATADLLAWADRLGLSWDMTEAADGEHWGCRLEEYLIDPTDIPDLNSWQTRLAFRLA